MILAFKNAPYVLQAHFPTLRRAIGTRWGTCAARVHAIKRQLKDDGILHAAY